ncbi:multicopper oxidase domain-containing protein [Paenarthrobacter sp. MSM-2-10-13]|uniref:Multicopper oxidase domain-containing protein n=3 Tax=Micrococcaceae TaxID=1268 RepID=A0AAX3EIP7_PAEUR|nr:MULTISPECIES: multicopper oxidase domain-containing protein [Paenarthrobacter]NKR13823.1 bilirubin oxidase [Arthrobacter sp. M5]NKR18570.1 bilirubin oxidase [Arthrobacter sp. M6]MDO5874027.1 multicopper oxidase domain-containing protein [Paenarthrobacter sp. SD-1]NHW49261.1 multicopper oxidase domain-containing protein [Paenarthrobacter sp. MSM-2-10-13]QMU81030.1 multicopper oxidase domain-containing protein [Paenarthrobacter ureafaciens]
MDITRRQAILMGGIASLGAVGAGLVTVPIASVSAKSASALRDSDMPRPYSAALTIPPVLAPTNTTVVDGVRTNYYTLSQQAGMARILPRLSTPILGYNGTFPGPTIKIERGTKAILRMRNRLPATHPSLGHTLAMSTHLHGSASLPQFDGYANDLCLPGFAKDYQFPNFQPARTLWYHDHAVHFTAQNVYSGLAGQYHLTDPEEKGLLPQGTYDVPLTVSDAMFAADGKLGFDTRQQSGLFGDVVLVNGQPWPVMKVRKRVYRFRVLNASISRSYRFYLSTGAPVTMVATDGGLMPVAQTVANWRHGGAERYEVLIDFSKYGTGQRVELRNLSNDNNRDYDHTSKVMAFDVVDDPIDKSDPTWNRLPTTLIPSEVMNLKAAAATKIRRFRLKHNDVTNAWTIDDRTWEDVIASNFREVMANPALNATEIWEFENSSGGWNHPLHIHLIDFQILSRNGKAPFAYEKGPKDVMYLGEGETVKAVMKFGPHKGRYMVHCHNLVHEDHSMMAQFSVGLGPTEVDLNDPILTARPAWDDKGD